MVFVTARAGALFFLFSFTAAFGCADRLATLSQLGKDAQTLRHIRTLPPAQAKEAINAYATPVKKAWYERAAVISDWVLASTLGYQVIASHVAAPENSWMSALVVIPAWYFADFATQVFHKFLDSYAREEGRIWGSSAREFRKHHEFPNNLNEVDTLSHLCAFGPAFAPLFLAANLVDMPPALGTAVWLFLVGTFHSTEFHRRAHLKDPGTFFSWMQSARLTLTREEHLAHHRPPFDGEFAILNGWSNGFARRVRLWERLDKLYWRVTRQLPHNWVQDPRSIPPSVLHDILEGLAEIPPGLVEYSPVFPSRIPAELAPHIGLPAK